MSEKNVNMSMPEGDTQKLAMRENVLSRLPSFKEKRNIELVEPKIETTEEEIKLLETKVRETLVGNLEVLQLGEEVYESEEYKNFLEYKVRIGLNSILEGGESEPLLDWYREKIKNEREQGK